MPIVVGVAHRVAVAVARLTDERRTDTAAIGDVEVRMPTRSCEAL